MSAAEQMAIENLTLGQTLETLSGGECQRLKLASELHNESAIYVLDEPTNGLHMADVEKFIRIIEGIVDRGYTVIIIEHNVDIIRRADWIIDMGSDGGIKGCGIVFEGTPQQLCYCEASLTAKYIVN